jgi:hypothetical protein
MTSRGVEDADEPTELDGVVAATADRDREGRGSTPPSAGLALICRPERVDLSELQSLAHSGRPRANPDLSLAVARIVLSIVLNLVTMLELWGFVSDADSRSTIPAALRPEIYTPDAPFSIVLDEGAIPCRSSP